MESKLLEEFKDIREAMMECMGTPEWSILDRKSEQIYEEWQEAGGVVFPLPF